MLRFKNKEGDVKIVDYDPKWDESVTALAILAALLCCFLIIPIVKRSKSKNECRASASSLLSENYFPDDNFTLGIVTKWGYFTLGKTASEYFGEVSSIKKETPTKEETKEETK